MSPSPNQTHLLCWRWSSGFRGNKSVVGFIRPLGKAPRVGKHGSWLPHGCHLPSQFGVSIDSGTHPFFPRGQHSLRSVKGRPLPSPSTPTETTKLLDSPFTAINATRTDRSTLRGRDRLQLISGSAAGERHPTNNASRQEKVFATWWPPIRCRRESRIGEQWHARGRSPRKRSGRVCG